MLLPPIRCGEACACWGVYGSNTTPAGLPSMANMIVTVRLMSLCNMGDSEVLLVTQEHPGSRKNKAALTLDPVGGVAGGRFLSPWLCTHSWSSAQAILCAACTLFFKSPPSWPRLQISYLPHPQPIIQLRQISIQNVSKMINLPPYTSREVAPANGCIFRTRVHTGSHQRSYETPLSTRIWERL